MYSQALTGATLQIYSCEDPGWWIHPDIPLTDKTAIFLPMHLDRYDSKEENFAWYKVSATHQAGHIEFGTFNFSFEKLVGLLSKQRRRLPLTNEASLTDIARFLSLFDDRKLAADIFAVVEDIRIDYLLRQEYAGISDSYLQIQQESLLSRPPLSSLSTKEAFLESFLWISLGSEPPLVPPILRDLLPSATQIIHRMQSPAATVEDSAEATLHLYEIASTIPGMPQPAKQESIDDSNSAELTITDIVLNTEENKRDVSPEQQACQSSVGVESGGSPDTKPFSIEDVKRFVNLPIDPTQVLRDHYPSSGFYVADFLSSATQNQEISSDTKAEDKHMSRITTLAENQENEVQSFLYDEWNFRTCSYLPKWCRVREIPLHPGSADFFNETLTRNSQLAKQLRKQFEMLAPEDLKKLTKLPDGEEFDLDAVIESVIERKSGHIPNEKVYWKRIRMQRDVAVVFLIDMSASTSELIKDADEKENHADWYPPAMEGTSQPGAGQTEGIPKRPRRRVIDVAKESVVLMINSLEILRDCYGVYGFSSSGRDNVELRVIKGIDEVFSDTIERRIDRIRPLFSTRMGPAIRHATSKLEARNEATKILFLVSDGYPQDRDYGIDSDDKEYAIRDTEMAFVEAKRKDIVPFCLTIDATGYDFLKEMSHNIDHVVLRNIESLPQHLSILYKRLTS